MDFKKHPPKKILMINIFGIGDVLFTTPLLSNLKKHFPSVGIGYLCNRRASEILKNNPCVDKTFIYERDEFYQILKQSKLAYVKKMNTFWQEIRKENYDTSLDVSLNNFMSFLTWGIGIQRRIGFNYKNRSLFLSQKIPLHGYTEKHVAEYYLDLLKEMGIPIEERQLKVYWTPEDVKWREKFLAQEGLTAKKPLIGLIPGGGVSWGRDAFYKRWPLEYYAQLADKLIEKFSTEVILMGSSEEAKLCLRVAELMCHKPHMACGETSMTQLAALLSVCQLVVLNDGGPLHVAVAAGTKTVSIFGPVDETVYGPYPRGTHKVVIKNLVCRPCYRNFRRAKCDHISCLNFIRPEDVLIKVEETLTEVKT